MKAAYNLKKSGYIVVLREIQKLLQHEDIGFAAIGAYIFFVFQADWDKRHKNYRAILPSDKQLAEYWKRSESAVFRNRKRLVGLNLLEEIEGNTYIKNLDMFNFGTVKTLAKKEVRIVKLHTYYAKSEKELDKIMFDIEKVQKTEAEN